MRKCTSTDIAWLISGGLITVCVDYISYAATRHFVVSKRRHQSLLNCAYSHRFLWSASSCLIRSVDKSPVDQCEERFILESEIRLHSFSGRLEATYIGHCFFKLEENHERKASLLWLTIMGLLKARYRISWMHAIESRIACSVGYRRYDFVSE